MADSILERIEKTENDVKLEKSLHFLDECCKDITSGCDIHVFLDDGRTENGKLAVEVPVGEKDVLKGFTDVELFFNTSNHFVTVVIHFHNKMATEKSAIYNLYEIYQRKSDEYFRHNEDRVSHLSMFFVKQDEEHGIVTVIDFHNPVLIVKNDQEGTLTCLCEMKGMNYGVRPLNYDEINEEIEYDIAEEVKVREREERHKEEIEEQQKFANTFTSVVGDEDDDF